MPTQYEDIRAFFARTGQNPDLADALMRVDAVAQSWRRQIRKRELGQRALYALGLEMDLAQLDVLFAIAAPQLDAENNADNEIMVSTVAERLDIDPSRASRIVSEMVGAGYARRTASQRDSRRTILELTLTGEAAVTAVRGYKWLLLGDFFAQWSKDDLDTFVPLLERYADWLRGSEMREGMFATEIAALAETVAQTRAQPVERLGSQGG